MSQDDDDNNDKNDNNQQEPSHSEETAPIPAVSSGTAKSALLTMSNTTEIILSILAYSCCSGSLVLVNKLILHHINYPSLVTTGQLWFTIGFIYCASFARILEVDPIKWVHVKPYLFYTVGFSLGIYCNMRSLAASNVETVIVFRAMAPILVSIADALFLGREWPSRRSWTALGLVVLGAHQYASNDEQFQSLGPSAYFWPTAYLFVISFEMAYGKKIVKSVDLRTKSGPVLYANLLGWPPMILFATLGGEVSRFQTALTDSSNGTGDPVFTSAGVTLMLLGCVVGTGIGYSGWWCRDKVSATSYTVIGVMNKCLTVIANCLIWDNHASNSGIASLFLCLIGGAMYRQAPLRKEIKGDDGNHKGQDESPSKKTTEMKPLMSRRTDESKV